jgi:hypothetical protein
VTLPVPTPRTWSVNDLASGALLNTNIRDAVNFLAKPPLFLGRQTTGQSIPTATYTSLALQTNDVDTYSGHSTVTNNSRYVAQVAGYYALAGVVCLSSSTQSHRGLFAKNGSGINGSNAIPVVGGATSAAADVVMPIVPVFLGVGDYVELQGYQDTGGTVTTPVSAPRQSSFTVWWLHS